MFLTVQRHSDANVSVLLLHLSLMGWELDQESREIPGSEPATLPEAHISGVVGSRRLSLLPISLPKF